GCRALCPDAVAPERWPLSLARSYPATAQTENAGSPDRTSSQTGNPASGFDDLRGCALDRSDEPRVIKPNRGPNKNCSSAAHRNFPPRIQSAMGGKLACDERDAQPAWEE